MLKDDLLLTDLETELERYELVRAETEALCSPLETEDYVIQAAPFASPTKWHLAHVTWFFETFILKPFSKDYKVYHESFEHLFNSYYQAIGEPFARPNRGWLSRPTVAQVFAYRAHVDRAMMRLEDKLASADIAEVLSRLTLGLNHEQQHQELLLMDLKYNLYQNPMYPAYIEERQPVVGDVDEMNFISFEGGLTKLGFKDDGFCFDNELPEHRVFLEPYALGDRLVTNGEYLAFMEDGGYRRSELWLSDGWDGCVSGQWSKPQYWVERDGAYFEFTLAGLVPLDLTAPVCHVNFFEADAYARWAGKRLPTEAEWEHAAAALAVEGHFADRRLYHPKAAAPGTGLKQVFGDLWEWTVSGYEPYPGYAPAEGAIGEYNGKFMCNQKVLRGGCCVTPAGHTRLTYRNFFYPDQRWQFSGIRLAQSPN